jgi:hypothetical protein
MCPVSRGSSQLSQGGVHMSRFKAFAMALVGVIAIAALTAGTASAKSQKLVLTYAGEEKLLEPGDTFDMVLYHWSESGGLGPNTFFLETESGTAKCPGTEFPFSGLHGTAQTNNEVKDTAKMESAAGALAFGTSCENTSGLGATASVGVQPNGAILGLSGSKGKTELKATSPTTPIYVVAAYSGGAECVWSTKKLKGTLTLEPYGFGSEWHQIVLSFTKSKVKLVKEFSSLECPKKATITASFGFQNRSEEGFGVGFFIFGKLV